MVMGKPSSSSSSLTFSGGTYLKKMAEDKIIYYFVITEKMHYDSFNILEQCY